MNRLIAIANWVKAQAGVLPPPSREVVIDTVISTYEQMADAQRDRIVEEVYARVMRELRTSQKLLPLLPPEVKFGEF